MWGHVCDTCAGSSGIEAFFHAIPGIGESCAKCIAKEYPCLRALARKYQGIRQAPHASTHDASTHDTHSKTDALDMLQDLRFAGQAACARTARLGEASQRVGQARSQRIHLLFHSRDPATVISTKKDEERKKDRTCV
jgi:hypothetical protein